MLVVDASSTIECLMFKLIHPFHVLKAQRSTLPFGGVYIDPLQNLALMAVEAIKSGDN